MSKVLSAPIEIDGYPDAHRLAQVPEGRKHYRPLKNSFDRFSLDFGKPPRLIASDCERNNETTLPQAFQLIGGEVVQSMITRPDNRLAKLVSSGKAQEEIVTELIWTVLQRPPTDPEKLRFTEYLTSGPDARRQIEDVAWALINSKEFLFQH